MYYVVVHTIYSVNIPSLKGTWTCLHVSTWFEMSVERIAEGITPPFVDRMKCRSEFCGLFVLLAEALSGWQRQGPACIKTCMLHIHVDSRSWVCHREAVHTSSNLFKRYLAKLLQNYCNILSILAIHTVCCRHRHLKHDIPLVVEDCYSFDTACSISATNSRFRVAWYWGCGLASFSWKECHYSSPG